MTSIAIPVILSRRSRVEGPLSSVEPYAASAGKAIRIAATPAMHASPPDTRRTGEWSPRHRAGLDIAEPRAAGNDEQEDRGHPAAHRVGRHRLVDRRPADRADAVGGAGDVSSAEAGHRGPKRPPTAIAAPHHHGRDHDPPQPAGVLEPAGGQGGHRRSRRHRRIEEAGAGRAGAVDADGEHGNSARGIPNVIARRSIANEPISAWSPARSAGRRAIERRTADVGPPGHAAAGRHRDRADDHRQAGRRRRRTAPTPKAAIAARRAGPDHERQLVEPKLKQAPIEPALAERGSGRSPSARRSRTRRSRRAARRAERAARPAGGAKAPIASRSRRRRGPIWSSRQEHAPVEPVRDRAAESEK